MKSKHCFSELAATFAATLVLLLTSPLVAAAPVKVTLNGVVFEDGGTILDGSSFILDRSAQTVTDIDIATSSGLGGPPFYLSGQSFAGTSGVFVYEPGLSCFSQVTCNSPILGDLALGFWGPLFTQVLSLNFNVAADESLTLIGVLDDRGAGGYRGAGTEAHAAYAQNASVGTIIVTPLSTIPEPGTFALAGLALAAVALSRRRFASPFR